MKINKLRLIYDCVVILDTNNAFVIDNKKFLIYKNDDSIVDTYEYGYEILYGIFLCKKRKAYEYDLLDINMNVLYTLGEDINLELMRLLDTFSYEQIKSLAGKYLTDLNRYYLSHFELININSRYKDIWAYLPTSINLQEKKLKGHKYETLTVKHRTNTSDSIYKDGKREVSFFNYNKYYGSTIKIMDDKLKFIRNNTDDYTRYYGNIYIDDKLVLKDVYGYNKILDTEDGVIYSINTGRSMGKCTYDVIKRTGNEVKILLSEINNIWRNNNTVLVEIDNKLYLYNKDLTQKFVHTLTYEFNTNSNKHFIISYINNKQEKVYLYFGDTTKEVLRVNKDRNIIIERLNSKDKLLSGLILVRDNTTNDILITIFKNLGTFKNYKENVYTDMTKFWSHIEKLDNNFNLDVNLAFSIETGLYYIVDSKGNILDKNSYESKEEAELDYIDRMKLKVIYKNNIQNEGIKIKRK